MLRKIKDKVWEILNLTAIGPLLQLYLVGEIKNNGWLKSFAKKKSVDAEGKNIPWITYPAIDFLKEKLNENIEVFEYGCGGSTKWIAERVKHITSVEDHKDWYDFVDKEKLNNMTLIFQATDSEHSYSKSIMNTNKKYDLIIIDGKERNKCIENCLNNLSETGIIMLDDSFRDEYKGSIQMLLNQGFKKLSFWGMVPVVTTKSCTSFFYKYPNIFNI